MMKDNGGFDLGRFVPDPYYLSILKIKPFDMGQADLGSGAGDHSGTDAVGAADVVFLASEAFLEMKFVAMQPAAGHDDACLRVIGASSRGRWLSR